MAARIGLSTGKEWVVEGSVDDVLMDISKGLNPIRVESQGKRVYLFFDQLVYVQEEQASVYEQRGVRSID
jgi:hypothetical protein